MTCFKESEGRLVSTLHEQATSQEKRKQEEFEDTKGTVPDLGTMRPCYFKHILLFKKTKG